MSKDEKESVIPDVIYDDNTGKSYIKGRFFGKVGNIFFLDVTIGQKQIENILIYSSIIPH